jgi:hypothetical protein
MKKQDVALLLLILAGFHCHKGKGYIHQICKGPFWAVQGFLVENEKANDTPAELAHSHTQLVALYCGGLLEMMLPEHLFLIQTLALDNMAPNTNSGTVLAKALQVAM